MKNIYGQWAHYYHDLGLNPLPIKDGKRPGPYRWQQYGMEAMSFTELEKLVLEWGSREEVTGIGVALTSDICAVDIDTFDRQFIFEASEILTNHGHSPLSARRGQEGKGFAVLMKRGPGILMRKKTQTECIEILCQGAQIVMPPSIHPVTQKPYVWLGPEYGFEGDPCHVDELPTFTAEMQAKLLAAMNKTGAARPDSLGGAHNPATRSIGGRNNKLTEMAWAKACEGVTLRQGAEELLAYDREHNRPPYFSDMSEPGNKPDPLANATFMYRRALKKLFITESPLDHEPQLIGPIIDPPNEPVSELSTTFADQFKIIRKNSLESEPLLELGAIKLFYELCQARSSIKTPMLALGGALTLMSMWAANLFEFASSRGNMFILNLAPSGTGKSIPQKVIEQVVKNMQFVQPARRQAWPSPNISHYLGQGKFRSTNSIRKDLDRNAKHARFDIQDEVSGFFKTVTTQPSAAAMLDSLQNIWSAADTGLPAEDVGDTKKSHPAVSNPYVTWFGSTTYAALQPFITIDKTDEGLIPRVLWMTDTVSAQERLDRIDSGDYMPFAVVDDDIVDDDHEDQDPEDVLDGLDDPEIIEHPAAVALKKASAYWIGKPPVFDIGGHYDSEAASAEVKVERLKITKASLAALKDLERQEVVNCAKLEETGSTLVPIMRRRTEQIKRITLLAWMASDGFVEAMSGGEKKAQRVIKPEHLLWATAVWDRMWAGFNVFLELDSTNLNSMAGVLDAVRKETLDWLKEEGRAVRPSELKKVFSRKLKKLDRSSKVNDVFVVFDQTLRNWVRYGNVTEDFGSASTKQSGRFRYLSH